MHFDFDDPAALARFAPAALDVEREPAGGEAPHFRILSGCVQLADVREHPRIGGRIGTGSTADRRLIDLDHLVQLFDSLNLFARAGMGFCPVQPRSKLLVEDLVDQRGFSRTGNPGDADELAQRNIDVDIFQVVLAGSQNPQLFAVSGPAGLRDLYFFRPAQVLAGNGFLAVQNPFHRAVVDHIAAVDARPRPDIHNVVGGEHSLLVVLHDEDGVPEVPQMLQRGEQLAVVPLMQADARLVEDVEHPHQG